MLLLVLQRPLSADVVNEKITSLVPNVDFPGHPLDKYWSFELQFSHESEQLPARFLLIGRLRGQPCLNHLFKLLAATDLGEVLL